MNGITMYTERVPARNGNVRGEKRTKASSCNSLFPDIRIKIPASEDPTIIGRKGAPS